MSIINPLLEVRFDQDPPGKYKALKIAMKTLAGSLCTDIYEHGLAGMGAHLTCTEFATKHPGIERPEISKPVKPAATATKVAFELYKEAKEEYSKYKAGTETLKSYLRDACKAKIMGAMTTADMAIPMMSITYIVNQLEEAYGTPTTRDVSRLQEDVNVPCREEADFLFYVQELKRNFVYLAEQREGYSEVQQMQLLTHGTSTLPNVTKAITRYVVANPRLADRSFEDMSNYITAEIPNFTDTVTRRSASAVEIALNTATASAMATTTSAPVKVATPITRDELEYCFAQLLGQMGAMTVRLPKRRQGNAKMGNGGTQLPNQTNTATPPHQRRTSQYCFVHGTNRSHAGTQCRVMALPSGFTEKQRKATAPGWIDGRQGAI